MTKTLHIVGQNICDIPTFYAEINRVFMAEEDWWLGDSLDALNDLLYGGYGAITGRVNRRYARGRDIHRWTFVRDGSTLEIACPGPLVLDSETMMRRAALDGAGVAFVAETDVEDDITAGRLERVLKEWCPPTLYTTPTNQTVTCPPQHCGRL